MSAVSTSTSPTSAEPPAVDEGVLALAEAVKLIPEDRDLPGWAHWLARPEKKVAIVGFTQSRDEAPWGNPDWEIWACNNLHLHLKPEQKWHRLLDLHDYQTISGDKAHEAFLRVADRPVMVWQPRPEWPTATAYPKDLVVEAFGRYFTNSISWMIALAIYEGATEIGVYGVDMATGSEYANQRPSCEYFLGFAAGRGIKVTIPISSDLCKVSALYGAEDDSALAAKIEARMKELQQRQAVLAQQYEQIRAQQFQVQGALENTRYFSAVWTNPRAARDGSKKPAEAPVEAGV